jgi:undecaprenyl diphosphate synthase
VRKPEHIAVIPDGNRRWAQSQGMSPEASYRPAIAHLDWLLGELWPGNCTTLSFWWGSVANLRHRPSGQVDEIRESLIWWLRERAPEALRRHGADLRMVGRWRELCPGLEDFLPEPLPGAQRRLNLLFAYDGRDELRAAADRLGGGGKSEEAFQEALWLGGSPPVDLVIRTGSAGHLSAGFMLWWIAEAQLAFTATLWPSLGSGELRSILSAYGRQQRRMGR